MSSSDNSGIALKSILRLFTHAAQDFSRGNDDEWHELREILNLYDRGVALLTRVSSELSARAAVV